MQTKQAIAYVAGATMVVGSLFATTVALADDGRQVTDQAEPVESAESPDPDSATSRDQTVADSTAPAPGGPIEAGDDDHDDGEVHDDEGGGYVEDEYDDDHDDEYSDDEADEDEDDDEAEEDDDEAEEDDDEDDDDEEEDGDDDEEEDGDGDD